MYNIYNPLFLFKKRHSILSRLKEIPDNIVWNILVKMMRKGFLYHPDFEKLAKIRDIHKGKVGLLIGNGPSVKLDDLEKIKRNSRVITFSANKFYLCYNNTVFRPNYTISCDPQMIDDFGEEMIRKNNLDTVFFVSYYKPQIISKSYYWIKLRNGRPFKFTKNIQKSIMVGGGTLIGALQIGYYMGIRQFFLYGVDHSFKLDFNKKEKCKSIRNAIGDGNHFIPGYRENKPWQAPQTELVEQAFKECDKVLRLENGFLKNATRGGNLEVVQRVGFEELLNQALYN